MGYLADRRQKQEPIHTRVTQEPGADAATTSPGVVPGLPDPPEVRATILFKDLLLHQVVGFATGFEQTVAATYTERHGIGLPELRILFLLARYRRLAPIRLAEHADTDRATVTRALRSLVDRGLVFVLPDPTHRRRTFVQLTPDGAALQDRLARFSQARNAWMRTHFTDAEQDALMSLLGRLEALVRQLNATPDGLPPPTGAASD